MSKNLVITLMLLVTLLAICIVYQPESRDFVEIAPTHPSNQDDYSIKSVEKVKKSVALWVFKSQDILTDLSKLPFDVSNKV